MGAGICLHCLLKWDWDSCYGLKFKQNKLCNDGISSPGVLGFSPILAEKLGLELSPPPPS